MRYRKLSLNILFICCLTVLLSSCASIGSIFNGSDKEKIGFPAQISLISLAKKFGSLDKALTPDINQCVFLDKDKPEESEEIFKNLVNKLVIKGAIKKAGLNEGHIKEAFHLVKSGEFKGDVYMTLGSLIKNVGDINRGVKDKLRNLVTDPEYSFSLIKKEPRYLIDINPEDASECRNGIRNLLINQNYNNLGQCAPGTVGKVIGILKKDSVTSEAIETARIFTNQNNRSARLAIIVYAKMYGINITEKDLDELDNFLNTKNDSDLSALIEIGVDQLARKYGGKDIVSFINEKDRECSVN